MSIFLRRATLTALILFISLNLYAQPKAKNGLLNVSNYDFGSQRLSLSGEWLWTDGELINLEESTDKVKTPVEFPKIWNEVRSTGIGQGVATYTLTILLPKGLNSYGIELPQFYSSYNLWVNSELLASNGKPGLTAESTQSQWMPQTVSFDAQDTIRLLLQVANFQHDKGGCKDPIYLGEKNTMLRKHSISAVSKWVECITLLIIAVVFVIIYFLRGRKKVIIYFSLLCATWSIRSAFSNDYIFISFMPDFDWTSMVQIEYITLYLTMIWAILFLSRLFANEGNPIIKYILVTLNSIFVVFTLFNQPLFFTKLLALYLFTSGVLLLYGFIIIIRAYINERTGAGFLTVCSLLGILIFSYDIFTYEGIFALNSIVLSAGYLVMFTLMALALLLQLNSKSQKKTPQTLSYKDLY
jgi:hypothetical protein